MLLLGLMSCYVSFYFILVYLIFSVFLFSNVRDYNTRISQTSVLGNIKTETERESAKRVANFPSEL